jgi:hypothetical protein
LIEKLAVPLKQTPLRVSIAGHTAAGFVPVRGDYGAFDLSADRANAVRQILEREGLPAGHIFAVAGKADTQPRRWPPTARHHHLDAGGSAAAARSQALDPKYHNTNQPSEVPGDCGVRAVAREKSSLLSLPN